MAATLSSPTLVGKESMSNDIWVELTVDIVTKDGLAPFLR